MNFRSGRGRGRGLSAMNLVKKVDNNNQSEDYAHEMGIDNPIQNISSDVFDENILSVKPVDKQDGEELKILKNRIDKLEKLISKIVLKLEKLDEKLDSGSISPGKHENQSSNLEDEKEDLEAELHAKSLMYKYRITRHKVNVDGPQLHFGISEKKIVQNFQNQEVCTSEKFQNEMKIESEKSKSFTEKNLSLKFFQEANLDVQDFKFSPVAMYKASNDLEGLRKEYLKMVLEADNNMNFRVKLEKIQNFSKVQEKYKEMFFNLKNNRYVSGFRSEKIIINTSQRNIKKLFVYFDFNLNGIFHRLTKNSLFVNVYTLFDEDDFLAIIKNDFSKVRLKIANYYSKLEVQKILLIDNLNLVFDSNEKRFLNVLGIKNYFYEVDDNVFHHHSSSNSYVKGKVKEFTRINYTCSSFNLDYCLLGFLKLYFSDEELNICSLFNYSHALENDYFVHVNHSI